MRILLLNGLQHIGECAVQHRIPLGDKGHIAPGLQMAGQLPRRAPPNFPRRILIVGRKQRPHHFLPFLVNNPLDDRVGVALRADPGLRRPDHRRRLQHPLRLHRQQFRVSRPHAYAVKPARFRSRVHFCPHTTKTGFIASSRSAPSGSSRPRDAATIVNSGDISASCSIR